MCCKQMAAIMMMHMLRSHRPSEKTATRFPRSERSGAHLQKGTMELAAHNMHKDTGSSIRTDCDHYKSQLQAGKWWWELVSPGVRRTATNMSSCEVHTTGGKGRVSGKAL